MTSIPELLALLQITDDRKEALSLLKQARQRFEYLMNQVLNMPLAHVPDFDFRAEKQALDAIDLIDRSHISNAAPLNQAGAGANIQVNRGSRRRSVAGPSSQ